MKNKDRKRAVQLREKGLSINEIVKRTGYAKSSVSIWVRGVVLTRLQKDRITKKGRSIESIEKRRSTRIKNEEEKRNAIIKTSRREISGITDNELKYIGVALYWAEGAKTQRGRVEFYNSDPRLIKIMMSFFKKVCNVEDEKFRGRVFLHRHLSASDAEKYWSDISGIPIKQFQKTIQAHNKASKNKKDSLPYGTFTIGVYDVKLFLRIMGWMEGVYDKLK